MTALQSLTQLTRLGLENNQISDVTALQSLTQLRELDLRNNKIENFNLDLTLLLKRSILRLSGNPIQNIPKEIFEQDRCAAVRAYQQKKKEDNDNK